MRANDMRAKVLMLLCLLAAAPTHAEMSGADYESGAGALSVDEREALRRKLADEIAAERARAAAAAAQEAAAATAEAARLARRPLGERLVEARCRSCHDTETLRRTARGWLGWYATVLRMQWINGAETARTERAEIVSWLVKANPASRLRIWTEWVVALGALGAGGLAVRVGLTLWGRRQ